MSGIKGDFDSAKHTFTSWNGCMSKAYCKWPVIIAIIIGSLILLSVLFCIFRCLCCGMECCFGCFRCCNACCPSPHRSQDRGSEYTAPPQQPANFSYPGPNPYQPQAPMMYGPPGMPYGPAKPQFATFETSSPHNASGLQARRPDALPPMPSWDEAETHRVEEPDFVPMSAHSAQSGLSADYEKEDGIAMGPISPSSRSAGLRSPRDEQLVPMLKENQYSGNAQNLRGDYEYADAGNLYSKQATLAGGDLGYQSQQQRQHSDRDNIYNHSNDEYGAGYRGITQPRSPAPIGTNPNQNATGNIDAPGPFRREIQSSVPPSYHTRIPSVSDHISTTSRVQTSSPPFRQQQQQQWSLRSPPSTAAAATRLNTRQETQRSPVNYSPSNYTYADDNSTVYEPPNSPNYRPGYSRSPPRQQQENRATQQQVDNNTFTPRTRAKDTSELFYPTNDGPMPSPRQTLSPSNRPYYSSNDNGGRQQAASRWGEQDPSETTRKPVPGSWREV